MSLATTSFTTCNFQKHPSSLHSRSRRPWISTTNLESCTARRRGVGLLGTSRRGHRHGTIMLDLNAVNNLSSGGSQIPSGGSPFPGWSNWMLLTIIPMIIPLLTNKWGPLIALKQKLDASLETVQDMSETIEEVARKVDNITDELQENLPEDSKFRKLVERIDDIAEETIKGADFAQELLEKIDDTTDQMEDMIKQSAQKKKKKQGEAQGKVPQEKQS